MRVFAGGVLVLALAWPALWAQDKSKDKAATPARQYQALAKEFDDAEQAYGKAKTEEERQKLRPQPETLAPRFLELAEKHPKDPAAVDALVWVVNHVREPGGGQDNPRARALAILSRDHLTNAKVAGVCESLIYPDDAESEAFLRAMMVKNPSPEARGRACLALAMQLHNRQQTLERLTGNEDNFDKEIVARLKKTDPTKLAKEIEHLLERAADRYGNVRHPFYGTIGKKATGDLYEMRFLAIGKSAPNIVGKDLDGKTFQLSDYRGKVVVLDFWGNW